MNNSSGLIFNIQRYSLHDGPGIRTVLFLKGCPLLCRWCSNPESQNAWPELIHHQSKCIGCLECRQACPSGAITASDGKAVVDRTCCRRCFTCTTHCPAKALNYAGQRLSAEQAFQSILADSNFYSRSGGGLTISGGEPLQQPGFTAALLQQAAKHHIDATIETCGYAAWDTLEYVCRYLKRSIIYDIKSLNCDKHFQFTGVENSLIISNLQQLRHCFPHLHILVRTPVIPGFNDCAADIADIARLVAGLPNTAYQLLPYHRLGVSKYQALGRHYCMSDAQLTAGCMQELTEHIEPLLDKTTT